MVSGGKSDQAGRPAAGQWCRRKKKGEFGGTSGRMVKAIHRGKSVRQLIAKLVKSLTSASNSSGPLHCS